MTTRREAEEMSMKTALTWVGSLGGLALVLLVGFQATVDERQNEALAEVRSQHQSYDQRQDQVMERISDKLQQVSETMHAVGETVRMIDERGTKFSLQMPPKER